WGRPGSCRPDRRRPPGPGTGRREARAAVVWGSCRQTFLGEGERGDVAAPSSLLVLTLDLAIPRLVHGREGLGPMAERAYCARMEPTARLWRTSSALPVGQPRLLRQRIAQRAEGGL